MVLIRTFHPTDLQDVMSLSNRTLGEIYNPGIYTTVFQFSPEGFLVAAENNNLIGFIIGIPEEKHLRILMLSVHERFQRRGIGGVLVQELMSRYMSKRFERIVLEVREGNDQGIKFYQKLGFTIDKMVPHYYSSGENAYRMSRVF